MKLINLSYLLVLLLPFQMVAQEVIYPATVHTKPVVAKKEKSKDLAKSDVLIELPFIDDFSVDNFPDNADGNDEIWEQRNAVLNNGLAIDPPTVGVASFDGTDAVGFPYSFDSGSGPADTLTSCPINLAYDTDDGIGISFYYQPKGTSFFLPSTETDSLILEFYAPQLDQWFWAWSTIDVSNPEGFNFVYIPITGTQYLMEGFQFRFRNIAFLQGLYSVWNLDYVWLDLNNLNSTPVVNDVAFVDGPVSFLQDYTAMPLSHYAENPADRMVQDFEVLFRNLNDGPRTLEDNEIVVSHEGGVTDVLVNLNEPPIQAQSTASYSHQLGDGGGQYIYDATLDEEELILDVSINLGTADFGPTVTNNSYRFRQSFFTNYAYDDGTAEAGYGVSNNGSRVAIRYTNFKSDSVWALRIYTMPYGLNFENTPFTIRIWEDDSGVPGEELAVASHEFIYGTEDYQEQIIYQFEEPVFIPSGTFFVGYQQSSQSEGLRVGLDFNTMGNEGNLFFDDGDGWTETVIAAGASVMIHPMFTTEGYQDIVTSTDDSVVIPGLKIYPNPAKRFVQIDGEFDGALSYAILDLSGRLVDAGQATSTIDVSTLNSGLFLLKLTDAEGRNGVKKLSIER